MVEDFYDRDFTELIVDDKTEMSQDELPFMQNAEETVKLKDGHSQISLPFKDREASVPNNKSQALQRANWLKKNLKDTQGCLKIARPSWQISWPKVTRTKSHWNR